MKGFDAPVIIGFPLRGEWMAPNTPEKRIPSHGTDQLRELNEITWKTNTSALSNCCLKRFYHTFTCVMCKKRACTYE